MSLDIIMKGPVYRERCSCPHCGTEHTAELQDTLFDANITHNLRRMAQAAGIHDQVWEPESCGITRPEQLIEPLTIAIADMKARPAYYEQFNAENGWGTYKDFVLWLDRYLAACMKYPDAELLVSR